ncbi:CBS domain-containing protein [Microbispora rosea]|uniref:CBS domain-containing protein n=1 Tax=Microbispora rosea TaxID=58117 RepID=UPI0037C795AB
MPHTVEEVMTRDPVTLPEEATVVKAAKLMRDRGIGDVLVVGDGRLRGLVTDRDIVVRAVAEGRDLATTPLATLCTCDVVTVGPDHDVAEAARLMREKDVRQLPVVVDGRPVGVVALADLTLALTPGDAPSDARSLTPGDAPGLTPDRVSGHAPAPA